MRERTSAIVSATRAQQQPALGRAVLDASMDHDLLSGLASVRVRLGALLSRVAHVTDMRMTPAEQHRRVIVGVNDFVTDEPELRIELLKIAEETEREQRQRMAKLRAERDSALVDKRLAALRDAAKTDANLMPFILDCARAYCTLYEIRAAMEAVFGAYREPVFF